MARDIKAAAYRECDYSNMFGIKEVFDTAGRAGLNYNYSLFLKKKRNIAQPKYPLMSELYTQWTEEAIYACNLEKLCIIRDVIDPSNSIANVLYLIVVVSFFYLFTILL